MVKKAVWVNSLDNASDGNRKTTHPTHSKSVGAFEKVNANRGQQNT